MSPMYTSTLTTSLGTKFNQVLFFLADLERHLCIKHDKKERIPSSIVMWSL